MSEEASYSIISYPSAKLPEQYLPLIFTKWLKSLLYGNPLFKKSDQSQYYKNYHAFIERLLKKPDSIVRLAVLSDDHDVVLGFAVSREDVLDYIYVNRGTEGEYRNKGIGRKLLPEGITTFSHITLNAMKIWQGNEKYKHLKFNPFA